MLRFALMRRNRFRSFLPNNQRMIKTPQLTEPPPRRSEDRGAWVKADALRGFVSIRLWTTVTCFWMPFGVAHTRTR